MDVFRLKLVQFLTKPYPAGVRDGITRLSTGGVADVCRYNFLLGQLFAEAALEVVSKAGRSMSDITVIGSHGQTICHLPQPRPLLHGYPVASSLQIGDPAVISARCGVTTVGDFRVADIALGGQGAPLVPYLDQTILRRHYRERGRVGLLLNIGGISNITAWLPVSGQLIGFDCGPGNVLIDSLMRRWYAAEFDKDGGTMLQASEGHVSRPLLESLVEQSRHYLDREPPKSLAREEFDEAYLELIITRSTQLGLSRPDTIATVTAFTAAMVAESYERHVRPRLDLECGSLGGSRDLFVSGGGAHNTAIMRSLRERLPGLGVGTSAAVAVDPDAKEAVCFALLALQTTRGVATSVPSVTGASQPALLGKICPAPPQTRVTTSSSLL
jgi:anhydro-N-acetylmuramic acid kinase